MRPPHVVEEDTKRSAAVVGLYLLLGLSIVRQSSLNRSFSLVP